MRLSLLIDYRRTVKAFGPVTEVIRGRFLLPILSCAFAPAIFQRAQIRAAIRESRCRTSVDLLALPELQRGEAGE